MLIQLEHIEAIEKRLWKAADTLWADSAYASNKYFLLVKTRDLLLPRLKGGEVAA